MHMKRLEPQVRCCRRAQWPTGSFLESEDEVKEQVFSEHFSNRPLQTDGHNWSASTFPEKSETTNRRHRSFHHASSDRSSSYTKWHDGLFRGSAWSSRLCTGRSRRSIAQDVGWRRACLKLFVLQSVAIHSFPSLFVSYGRSQNLSMAAYPQSVLFTLYDSNFLQNLSLGMIFKKFAKEWSIQFEEGLLLCVSVSKSVRRGTQLAHALLNRPVYYAHSITILRNRCHLQNSSTQSANFWT